jgi:glycosyltransferase involved in cell wall biosynthesis
MDNKRLLFIGYWNFPINHRGKHIAAYLEDCFGSVDLLGFGSFYSGSDSSAASALHKARVGISNLLHHRLSISERGSVREIVIRDLYAPYALHSLIDDLWRYLVVRKVIAPPYDVAVFCGPENALLAWLCKRSGSASRLIYDDHDYFPGLQHGKFRRWVMERRELFCVHQADGVISANPLLARLRRDQGARDVVVIPNGVDLPLFALARQKVPHPPTLIYMGNLSRWWGIDLAIKAMPALLRIMPNLRFLIAGEGSEGANLRALSQDLGLMHSVHFMGRLSYRDLPALLAESDVGIATSQPDSEFRKYATPLKVVEYMAAGLPVIANRVGQTEIMMEEANAGILFDYSVENFVAAATDLLCDSVLYEHYSQAAVAYAKGFDWAILMEQVYQYIRDIIDGD